MTTIAWDGKTLAGDRGVIVNKRRAGQFTKVLRTQDGRLFGVAGHLAEVEAIADWLKDPNNTGKRVLNTKTSKVWQRRLRWLGIKIGPVFVASANTAVLEIISRTSICVHEAQGSVLVENSGFQSIGSGHHFAIGAMAQGATALEAVKIAAHFDIYTSYDIETLKF